MKRLFALALLLLVGPAFADTVCIGAGCGGGGVSAASPSFTGTATFDRLNVSPGGVPTCTVTGAGAAATCVVQSSSSDSAGLVQINTDSAGTAALGTLTITFAAAHAGSPPICMGFPQDAGALWNVRAVAHSGNGSSTTACVFRWDNNAVVLTVSDTYQFNYLVIGR